MPKYDYRCSAGHQYEKREGFDAPALQDCQVCGIPARRLLTAPSIVFKGSGWYVNDSRKSSPSSTDQPAPSTDASSDTSSESKTESTSESKAETKSESKSETTKSESKPDASATKAAAAAD